MKRNAKIFPMLVLCLIVGAVLCMSIPIGFFVWHTSQCRNFCRTVSSLPRGDLAAFALRCDVLRTKTSARYTSITDNETLRRFELAGKAPVLIEISPRGVYFHYLGMARSAARISWEDYSQWGKGWRLSATPGEAASTVIYEPRE